MVSDAASGLERLAPAASYGVWFLPGGALFAARTTFRWFDGPLATALVRALARPRPRLALAQEAAASAQRPLSEALFALMCWHDDGLLTVQPDEPPPFESPAACPAPLVLYRSLAEPGLAERLPEDRPALFVSPYADGLWIGPYVAPGDAAALAEACARAARTHPAEALARRLGGTCVHAPTPGAARSCWEAARPWLERPERLRGQVRWMAEGERPCTFRLWETARPRRPAPFCGVPDGGYRTVSPSATVRRVRSLVNPVAGPVAALRRARMPGPGLTMHLGAHGLSHTPLSFAHLRESRQWSAGKGVTAAQAQASAVCEALERHCGVWRGNEPVRHACWQDLDGAIHPHDLLLFSEAQYDARARSNARDASPASWVPERFAPNVPVLWSPVRSLLNGQERFVPAAWAYYGTTDPEALRFMAADSNGAAAGNTREEALLQGLLELAERDAVALWWYSRARRPGVDLDALAHPLLDGVRTCCQRLHRDLWALDLTHDLGLPVFAALSRRRAEDVGGPEHVVFGFGCHLDPAVALLRAVSELVQALPYDALRPKRPGAIPGLPDWGTTATRWLTSATVLDEPYLLPSDAPPTCVPLPPRRLDGPLGDAVQAVLSRIAAAVPDVLVLDQTRDDVPLHVVKVLAPGLRHFWRRLAPGRLYTVPQALGWTDRPIQEPDLNPWPMFA